MKKKLLGIVLALVLVICLLPVTTFASVPTKVKVYKYSLGETSFEMHGTSTYETSHTKYVAVVDNTSTEEGAPAKMITYPAAKSSTRPTDNFVKFKYRTTGGKDGRGLLTIHFKNFDTTQVAQTGSGTLFQIGYSASSGDFDIEITLEGTNVITAPGGSPFVIKNTSGDVSITGSGSLHMITTRASSNLFGKASAGDLLIKDTTVTGEIDTLDQATPGLGHGFNLNGNVTIDGSTVNLVTNNGAAIRTSTDRDTSILAKDVTIKNGSNVIFDQHAGQENVVANGGEFTIENSNVLLDGNENGSRALDKAPTLVGNFGVKQFSVWNKDYVDFKALTYTPEAAFASNVRYFNFVHEHAYTYSDCTAEGVCGCTKSTAPAMAEAHSFTDKASDQIKETNGAMAVYYVQCDNCDVVSDTVTVVSCAHINTETVTGYAPTCTEDGKGDGEKCSDCGAITVEQEVIPAAHTPGAEPTCTTEQTCTECGVVLQDALGHPLVARGITGTNYYVTPTCTESGYTHHKYCTRCERYFGWGTNSTPANNKNKIGYASMEEFYVAPLGHNEGEPVLDEATNELVTSCTRCNEEISREPAACKHTNAAPGEAKDATCTEDGRTAGVYCPDCKTWTVEQETIPATKHKNAAPGEAKDATCTEDGHTAGVYCPDCETWIEEQKSISATNHKNAAPGEAKDATCTEDGHTAGVYCPDCKTWTVEQETIPATKHKNAAPGEAKDATCTEDGHTAGVYCPDCETWIEEQKPISATNHKNAAPGEAKDATCTEDGHTAGVYCPDCKTWTVEQETIPATKHKNAAPGEAKDATCTEDGHTAGVYCPDCETWIEEQKPISATNHKNAAPGEAKDATCTEDGHTAGVYCPDCKTWIEEQEPIKALGHTQQTVKGKDATCTEDGLTDGIVCSVCGETIKAQETIKALGHTEQTVKGKDATCTEDGLTDGIVCSVCNVTIKAQETIKAEGHKEETVKGKDATCTEDGLTDGIVCSVCETTIKAQETIQAKGHDHKEIGYTDPTFEADGFWTYKCHCGDEYTKVDTGSKKIAVASVNDTKYETFAEAWAAAQAGDTVTLFADLKLSQILTIDKAIVLDGNGHKLTSTAGRAINVSGADGVVIKNLTVTTTGERAINVIQGATNLTLDNVTATAANYTVNIASSAPNAVVTIKNSTLNGLCTVNVSAAGAKVTVDNSIVNCNDNNTTAGEAYAALSLNKEAVGGSIVATNTTINVAEGSDSYKGRNGAENGTVTINGSTEDVLVIVAVITYEGSNYYHSFASLAEAIEFAKAGDVITLIRDITASQIITIDKAITLDGNGHTLTSTAARAINIDTTGNVVINDLTINAGERAINIINKASTVELNNVTATAKNNAVMIATSAGAVKLTINDSDLTGLAVVNVAGAGAEAEINNTDITNVDASSAENYGAITIWSSAEAANVTVNGGNITVGDDSREAYVFPADATIEGVEDVGYIVATIGDAGFETLEAAIKAAKAGQTIKLIRDIELTEGVVVPTGKNIVLDLAGYDISMTVAEASKFTNVITNNGTLTIIDSAEEDGEICLTYTGANNRNVSISTIGNYGILNIQGGVINCISGNQNISYAIDSIANSNVEINISGGIVKGGRAGYSIRMFLNSTVNNNVLNVTGGEVGYVWAQNTNANANKASINVTGGYVSYVYVAAANGAACDVSNITLNVKAECTTWAPYVGSNNNIYVLKNTDGIYNIHNHVFTAEVTDPTCTEKGYTTYTCSVCGDTHIADEVAALGHDIVIDKAVAATCTETGLTEGQHCSRCDGATIAQKEVAAKGHKSSKVEVISATCTEDGYLLITCNACGETFDSREEGFAKDYLNGPLGQFYKLTALGHDIVIDKAVAATCTETGLTEGQHCSRCDGATIAQEEVAAKGHKSSKVEVISATCTEDGYLLITCNACGETFDSREEGFAKDYLNGPLGQFYKLAALGHDIVIDKAVAATCTETGLTEGQHCSRCDGATIAQEEVAAKGHKSSKVEVISATCTEDGYLLITCNACGETFDSREEGFAKDYLNGPLGQFYKLAALGHDIVIDKAVAATCTETGLTEGQHCSRCDGATIAQEEVAAKGHAKKTVIENNVAASCTKGGSYDEVVYCTVCEAELSRNTATVPAKGHAYKENVMAPDCYNGGCTIFTCSVCGATYVGDFVPATGHTAGQAKVENTVDPDCINTGSYDEVVYCVDCGAELSRTAKTVAALGHKYESKVTDPDCVNEGYTTYTCSVCGDSYKGNVVPATGHTFDQQVISKMYRKAAATINSKAVFYYACSCGESSKGYANEATFEYGELAGGAVASVDGYNYATFEEAVAAAIESGKEVKLLTNIKNGKAIVINGNVTIDFGNNFYTVNQTTEEAGEAAFVIKSGNVTLKNGKVQVLYAARTSFKYLVVNNGTLTTENVTLSGNNLYAEGETYTIVNNGTLALNAGTVVNVRVNGLKGSSNVTKAASVELAAPEGTCWKNETVLSAHIYELTETVDSTCTVEGHKTYTCACGASYEEAIPVIAHTFDQNVVNIKYRKATATLNSKAVYYTSCSCGESSKGYANEATFEYGEFAAGAVAEANGVYYASFAEAIAAVNGTGKEAKLLKDVNNGVALIIDGDVIINLNGHIYTVSQASEEAAMIIKSGNVTVKDGKLQARYSNRTAFKYLVVNNGTLTTENATLSGNNLYAEGETYTIVNNGTLALNAGTVVNVRVNSLKGSSNVTKAASVELAAPEGTCWKNETVLSAHEYVTTSIPATVYEFSYDLHVCSACGHSYKDNYGTKKLTAIAKIVRGEDEFLFTSLVEALAEAQDGDVVTLLQNVNNGAAIVIEKNLTIDFGGKTYTVFTPDNGAAVVIGAGKDVTLTNGTVQIRYTEREKFHTLVVNSGNLTISDITLKSNNACALDAYRMSFVVKNTSGTSSILSNNVTVVKADHQIAGF